MLKKTFFVFFTFVISLQLFAASTTISPDTLWILFKEDIILNSLDSAVYDNTGVDVNYRSPFFNLRIDGGFNNDGKFPSQDGSYGGRYLAINDTYIELHSNRLSFKAGRALHRDIVETPYSVFISSENIPTVLMDFSYAGDFFFYETRWIRLNTRSAYTYNGSEKSSTRWDNKGANLKVFGIHLGDFRLGFEDSITYIGRSFDTEYFFNPMPEFFTELITTLGGAPWKENSNTNSLMGFFTDITKPKWYGEAQFLMDDANVDFLTGRKNCTVNKIAWSLGGYYTFDFGRIGFYSGGATKYTFEATYGNPGDYSSYPYEYTYYPVVEYGSNNTPIQYTDNYIGYKYGENNLSFLLDYANNFFTGKPYAFNLYSSMELVFNGSKSPANPWHEYYWCSSICPHTILFDDPYIEKRITSATRIEKALGNFTIALKLEAGYVWNELTLKDVVGGGTEAKMYVADPDCDHYIFNTTISVSYNWKLE